MSRTRSAGPADGQTPESGPRWWTTLRRVAAATREELRGKDLALHAAGVTFYGAIAVVPLLLLAGWLATVLVGEERVLGFAQTLGQALPSTLGAGEVASEIIARASELGVLGALLALLPATLYGEGVWRSYASLSGAPDTRGARRGRLAVLPVLAAAPLLLLGVLAVTPLLAELVGSGPGSTALGVYLATRQAASLAGQSLR